MPMARSAVLIGRTAADLVRNVLIIVLMIIVGYIIGFGFQGRVVAQALACIALVTAFGLALELDLCLRLPLTVRSAEAAQSAGFVDPVFRLCVREPHVFVPVSTLPSWAAGKSPRSATVTLTANAARLPRPRPRNTILPRRRKSPGSRALAPPSSFPLSVWRYRRMDLRRQSVVLRFARITVIRWTPPQPARRPKTRASEPGKRPQTNRTEGEILREHRTARETSTQILRQFSLPRRAAVVSTSNGDCSERRLSAQAAARRRDRDRRRTGRRPNRRDHGRRKSNLATIVSLLPWRAVYYVMSERLSPRRLTWPRRSAGGRTPRSSPSTTGSPPSTRIRRRFDDALAAYEALLNNGIAPTDTSPSREESAGGGLAGRDPWSTPAIQRACPCQPRPSSCHPIADLTLGRDNHGTKREVDALLSRETPPKPPSPPIIPAGQRRRSQPSSAQYIRRTLSGFAAP